jgi:hypothetical protein
MLGFSNFLTFWILRKEGVREDVGYFPRHIVILFFANMPLTLPARIGTYVGGSITAGTLAFTSALLFVQPFLPDPYATNISNATNIDGSLGMPILLTNRSLIYLCPLRLLEELVYYQRIKSVECSRILFNRILL